MDFENYLYHVNVVTETAKVYASSYVSLAVSLDGTFDLHTLQFKYEQPNTDCFTMNWCCWVVCDGVAGCMAAGMVLTAGEGGRPLKIYLKTGPRVGG